MTHGDRSLAREVLRLFDLRREPRGHGFGRHAKARAEAGTHAQGAARRVRSRSRTAEDVKPAQDDTAFASRSRG
jgi:hypothetical protein